MKLVKIIVLSFVMVGSGYACWQCAQAEEMIEKVLLYDLALLELRADIAKIRFNRLAKSYEQLLLEKLVSRRQILFKLLDTRSQ